MKFLLALLITALSAMNAKADPVAIHGMALFGQKATYLSHMPMFHSPHDYQVVMKAHLNEAAGKHTLVQYEALKLKGESFFTVLPQPLDLTKIISGQIKEFGAQLYLGHFEKGGTKIGPIVVQVENTLVSSKLNPSAQELNKYFLFGENGEYFAVHLIDGQPSFDSIVKVSAPYEFDFPSCRTRVCADPKMTPILDSELPQTVGGPVAVGSDKKPVVGAQIGNLGGVLADVLQVLYFEQAELD